MKNHKKIRCALCERFGWPLGRQKRQKTDQGEAFLGAIFDDKFKKNIQKNYAKIAAEKV